MTNTSFPWGVSLVFMEITNASQNIDGDRLFMEKEEPELHVKIKYKTKYGMLSRLRKQKEEVEVTNATKSLGKLRASLWRIQLNHDLIRTHSRTSLMVYL